MNNSQSVNFWLYEAFSTCRARMGQLWRHLKDFESSPVWRLIEFKISKGQRTRDALNLEIVLDRLGVRRLTIDDFEGPRGFNSYNKYGAIAASLSLLLCTLMGVLALWNPYLVSPEEVVYRASRLGVAPEVIEMRLGIHAGQPSPQWSDLLVWFLVSPIIYLGAVGARLLMRWKRASYASESSTEIWMLWYLYVFFLIAVPSRSTDGGISFFVEALFVDPWGAVGQAVLIFALVYLIFYKWAMRKEGAIRIASDRGRLMRLRSLLTEHQVKNLLEPLRNSLRDGSVERASRYVETLAKHLPSLSVRFESDTWPLKAELDSVERQLVIDQQRIRSIVYRVDKGIWGEPESGAPPFAVPPMLLQPLIENAVAAASGRAPEGGLYFVLVRATANGFVSEGERDTLILQVASWHRPIIDGTDGWVQEFDGAVCRLEELGDDALSRPNLDAAEKSEVMRGHELTYRYARSILGNGAQLRVGQLPYEPPSGVPGSAPRVMHVAKLALNASALRAASNPS